MGSLKFRGLSLDDKFIEGFLALLGVVRTRRQGGVALSHTGPLKFCVSRAFEAKEKFGASQRQAQTLETPDGTYLDFT